MMDLNHSRNLAARPLARLNSRTKQIAKIKWPLLFPPALCSLFAALNPVSAQTWTTTSAPNLPWCSIASSADGSKLVAVPFRTADLTGPDKIISPGQIYTSTNSGATWQLTSPPGNDWRCVAASADGSVLLAGALDSFSDTFFLQQGSVWVSTNSGNTWMPAGLPADSWWSVAASANGRKLVAGGSIDDSFPNGILCTSTNSGVTWTTTMFSGLIFNPRNIACSADGNKLAAIDSNNSVIYTSANFGLTWTLSGAPPNGWSAIASSADGNKLAAVAQGYGPPDDGGIYVSTNGGATWTQTSAPYGNWEDIASSADGTKLAAVDFTSHYVYTSTNSGFTWTSNSLPDIGWSVASSADGNKLVAAHFYVDQTYTNDSGQIYTLQSTPAPVLSLIASDTNSIISWTVPSLNFGLQQNSDLTTTNWTDVTNPPIVLNLTNLQNQVTVSRTNSSRFYRLVH